MINIYITSLLMGIYLAFININGCNKNVFKNIVNFIVIFIVVIILYKNISICPLFIITLSLSIISYIDTKKIILSFIKPLLSTIIYIGIRTVCYSIYFFIFNKSIFNKGNALHMIFYFLLIYILTYILTKYLRKKFIVYVYESNILQKFQVQILIAINCSLMIIIYIENMRQIKVLKLSGFEIKIELLLILLYFITFTSFMFLILVISKQKRINEIIEYNEKLEDLTSEMNKFRHDYKNILVTMKEYIQKGDMQSLSLFFDKNIEPLNRKLDKNNVNIASIKNIKNLEIKGILSSKIVKADELKIDIKVDVLNPIEDISIDIIDCCRILAIVLDNSIEASMQCENPKLEILIVNNKDYTSFTISNSYLNKIENISDLFKEGFSTKGNNRGIGLSNLKSILECYDNVYFNISAKDRFVQTIDIYNKVMMH